MITQYRDLCQNKKLPHLSRNVSEVTPNPEKHKATWKRRETGRLHQSKSETRRNFHRITQKFDTDKSTFREQRNRFSDLEDVSDVQSGNTCNECGNFQG